MQCSSGSRECEWYHGTCTGPKQGRARLYPLAPLPPEAEWAFRLRQADESQGAAGWDGCDDLGHALSVPAQAEVRCPADNLGHRARVTLAEAAAHDERAGEWHWHRAPPAGPWWAVKGGDAARWHPPSPERTSQQGWEAHYEEKRRRSLAHRSRHFGWQPRARPLTLGAAVWAAFSGQTLQHAEELSEASEELSEASDHLEETAEEADARLRQELSQAQGEAARLQDELGTLRVERAEAKAAEELASGVANSQAWAEGYRCGQAAALSGQEMERRMDARAAQTRSEVGRELGPLLHSGVRIMGDAEARAGRLERQLQDAQRQLQDMRRASPRQGSSGGPAEPAKRQRTEEPGDAQSVSAWLHEARGWLGSWDVNARRSAPAATPPPAAGAPAEWPPAHAAVPPGAAERPPAPASVPPAAAAGAPRRLAEHTARDMYEETSGAGHADVTMATEADVAMFS